MRQSIRTKVRVEGIASCVPIHRRNHADDAEFLDASRLPSIAKTTGIRERRVVREMCTSDLCVAAAEQLFAETGVDLSTIDVLLFVSQTPDQLLPATACMIHHRLGLDSNCASLDVNLGCSGYVYGLWMAAKLLGNVPGRRALLLAGDTISRIVSPSNVATAPLFGDAGTATLVVVDHEASPLVITLGTDGSGAPHLCVPAGGFRQPSTEETRTPKASKAGARADEHLYMDGAEVFNFTLTRVPAMIADVLDGCSWTPADIDAFVPHQANAFMLRHLARKMKLSKEQLVLSLEGFGNTSSASIPLALTTKLRERLSQEPMNLVLAGFGVGWSWGAVAGNFGPVIMPELLEVEG